MKKALSILLALALCLSLAIPALAADPPERGTLHYAVMIEPQYENAHQFSEGLAAVEKDGKWGYVDTDNNVVIPFAYGLAFDFHEGYAVVMPEAHMNAYEYVNEMTGEPVHVVSYSGDLGFIDHAGTYTPFMISSYGGELIPVETYLSGDTTIRFHNGFAVIPSDMMNELGRTDGTILRIGELGDGAYPIYQMTEGLICFAEYGFSGGVGWADASGSVVMRFPGEYEGMQSGENPFTYISEVAPFNQGLAPVWQCTATRISGEEEWPQFSNVYKLGFMDRDGNWVIEPQFSRYFRSDTEGAFRVFGVTGLAMVQKDGKYGAIDKTGKTVIPFEYEELWPVNNGLILYKQDGLYGYMDAETLQTVIAPQYQMATGFSSLGLAVAYDGSRAYLIDRSGSAIPGADTLDPETYFIQKGDGSVTTFNPQEYVVLNVDGKYGFGHITYRQPLPEKSAMHAWAYDEVAEAIEKNLVPEYLQNLYRADIKRNEFCDLVMQAVCEIAGKDMETLVLEKTGRTLADARHDYPFTDSAEATVIAAYSLGIVNGRGNNRFDPYAGINRQEAAAMLMRAAQVLGAEVGDAQDAGFADGAKIASWAQEAVNYVFAHNIMNGTGKNAFSPKNPYTREQSYMTILRLFRDIME